MSRLDFELNRQRSLCLTFAQAFVGKLSLCQFGLALYNLEFLQLFDYLTYDRLINCALDMHWIRPAHEGKNFKAKRLRLDLFQIEAGLIPQQLVSYDILNV